MKKHYLISMMTMLCMALGVSAQNNTYSMLIEMANGTTLTIGPNDVKNITFNDGEVTASGESIESLMKNIAQLSDAINQGKASQDELANELAKMVADMQNVRQMADSLGTAVNDSLTAMKDSLGTITDSVDAVVASVLKQVKANTNKVDSIGVVLAPLKKDFDTYKPYFGSISQYKQKIEANETNISTLQTKVASMETSVSSAASAAETNKTSISKLSSDVDTKIAAIKEELKNKASAESVSQLISRISTLEAKVKELEGKIKE